MNKDFWKEHYKKHKIKEPSTFAQYVSEHITEAMVDLGCGDGRDLYYFKSLGIPCLGVDSANDGMFILEMDVMEYVKTHKSPKHVYARFFWHAIEPEEQEAILKWTKKNIYIEARTKKDKPKNIIGKHKRNLVSTRKLKQQLKEHGFEIKEWEEGYGLSPYKGEDPHLVRVIAEKK